MDTLKEDIRKLRRLLGRYRADPLARSLAILFHKDTADTAKEYGLSSPYRQVCFAAGLMLTTSEPTGPAAEDRSVPQESIVRCCELLESIFQHYGDMYYPTEREIALGEHKTEAWEISRRVAMAAFLNFFNTTRLMASVEQLADRVIGTCVPFDDALKIELGISATDALGICKIATEGVQQSLDAMVDAGLHVNKLRREYIERYKNEPGNYSLFVEARKDPSVQNAITTMLSALDGAFTVRRRDLEDKCGLDVVTPFWSKFVSRRGSASPQFAYPTDPNPFDYRPLIEISDGVAICAVGNSLYWAILLQATEALSRTDQEAALRQRYLRTRDRFLETQTRGILAPFFGADATVVSSSYETQNKCFEHDLIIFWHRSLLVIECKAGVHSAPLRDPDRAYVRIKDEFKKNVQKAFDQASRIRTALAEACESGTAWSLYDEAGNCALTLTPSTDIDEVYSICVTADNLGMLAVDLPLLLKKEDGADYPWCVNVIDLENLIEGLVYRSWGPAEMLRYLASRSRLQGKIAVADELEIAGIFLTEGSLKSLEEAAATVDLVALEPETAHIFSQIYLAVRNRGPHIDFDKVKPLYYHDLNPLLERAFGKAVAEREAGVSGPPSRSVSPTAGTLKRTARHIVRSGIESPRFDNLRNDTSQTTDQPKTGLPKASKFEKSATNKKLHRN